MSALPLGSAALAAALVAGLAVWIARPSPAPPPVTRFALTLPESQTLSPSGRHMLGVSPDGTQFVYVAANRLFLRRLSELEAQMIPGVQETLAISSPTFSPDGRSIAFHSQEQNAVKRVPIGGGAPVTVCSANPPSGMTWHSSGLLIGQLKDGILRCSPNGGAPERMASVAPGEQAHGPQILPDGSLMFTVATIADGPSRWDKARIVAQASGSRAQKTILTGGSDARYAPTGHLLYAASGMVFAVPFDPSRQVISGGPVTVIEGVRRPLAFNTGAAQFDVSQTGTLVYLPGPAGAQSAERALAIADRSGTIKRLSVAAGAFTHVRATQDGKRLAIGSDDGKEAIVWVYDLAGASAIRRLTIGSQNRFPIWSPDSQRVAFQSDRAGDHAIYAQRADGTGEAERLTTPAAGESHVPESWSPDGKHLSVSVVRDGKYSLSFLSVEDKKLTPLAGAESREPMGSVFSPDGQWIAYSWSPENNAAANSPNRGVYIQPFPAVGATRYQMPRQQMDFQPVWGPKGDELIYVPTAASGRMAVVPVTTRPAVTFGTPTTVPGVVTGGRLSGETRAYDILPDGTFVGLIAPTQDVSSANDASQFRIVVNWFEELKQRLAIR